MFCYFCSVKYLQNRNTQKLYNLSKTLTNVTKQQLKNYRILKIAKKNLELRLIVAITTNKT